MYLIICLKYLQDGNADANTTSGLPDTQICDGSGLTQYKILTHDNGSPFSLL